MRVSGFPIDRTLKMIGICEGFEEEKEQTVGLSPECSFRSAKYTKLLQGDFSN
jgi:hypothetical protein